MIVQYNCAFVNELTPLPERHSDHLRLAFTQHPPHRLHLPRRCLTGRPRAQINRRPALGGQRFGERLDRPGGAEHDFAAGLSTLFVSMMRYLFQLTVVERLHHD